MDPPTGYSQSSPCAIMRSAQDFLDRNPPPGLPFSSSPRFPVNGIVVGQDSSDDRRREGALKPREIIDRKKKTYFLIVGISFAGLFLLAFLEKQIPPSSFHAIAIATGAVFVAGVLLLYWGIRCPKCGKTLGLKFVYSEETLNRCPGCGIPFDEDSL